MTPEQALTPEKIMRQELERRERNGLISRKGSTAWAIGMQSRIILNAAYGRDKIMQISDDHNKTHDRGKCIGYTGAKCKNCGRVRVELWENGDEICEKCNWNQWKGEYERPDY